MSKQRASAQEVVRPATVLGCDLRRVASCADTHNGRYDIGHVELSPVGLTATNGSILCVINAPGWPYQCYLDPNDARAVKPESEMSVNGAVEFIGKGHDHARIALPHKNPDEVNFPKWKQVLPDASTLVPVGTFGVTLLKKLIAALLREPTSAITIYARTDDGGGPILLANEVGDLGVIMPVIEGHGEGSITHFPTQVYEAFGLGTQTEPALAQPIPQNTIVPGQPDALLTEATPEGQ